MTRSQEKSAHTPGPWHRGLRRAAGRIEIKNESGNLIAMANGWPEADANARLIAAAPDLLSTLRMLLVHCDASSADETGWERAVSAAREAVAKAEGRS